MDYAVYHNMSREYLGTIGVDNGAVVVKAEASKGDLEVVIADLEHYGIEGGIEHLSRYLAFVNVETGAVYTGE